LAKVSFAIRSISARLCACALSIGNMPKQQTSLRL
jgi:hypothetical protein